jgi:asparagine synthase (glutamine-hydrolysing)
MLAALNAYGPDGSACESHGPLSLGRSLYALLPEDDFDHQPVVAGGGRFSLVADLRLDNRSELASALGVDPTHVPKLADSDILAKALERWGEAAPGRLLGDFAFAWFDQHERVLLLARDPLGQRPLFWYQQREFIAFGSMPKGLHALVGIPRAGDEDAAAKFLANIPRNPGQGYFRGVQRVPPGHVVRLTPVETTTERYWTPRRQTLRLPRFEDYVEAYRSELDRSVRCRLRTRAGTIASHLSAGWDSGAVSATAARLSSGEIAAFTSVPARASGADAPRNYFADEGPLAAAVAAMHGNIEHHLIESDGASPLDQLENGARWFERPLFNLCNHGWLAQIREAARDRGAQVLLSGEIGNWTISAAPVTLLAEYAREFGWAKWWRAVRGLKRTTPARWRGLLAATFQRDRRDHFEDTRNAFFDMDFGEHRKGILGGWGIDKRDATADVRLIEFCLSLPLDMLIGESGRRPLARAALADRLPAAVLEARRKGYQGADWHEGLARDLGRAHKLVEAIASDASASRVVDAERLRRLLRAWPSRDMNSAAVIATYRNSFLQALTAGHFLIRAGGREAPL